ncbi:MAG: hypothetical protein LBV12_02710 [Puniceicoccales bacterium]|nr:hypothetical protein [Puniceicoccales bacterium]
MSSFGKTKLFTGRHSGKLDDKNRLTIPAPWRFETEGDAAYLATFYPATGTILVLPPEMVQQIADAASRVALSDPDKHEAMITLGENSTTVSCDKAGRIVLNESMLRQAGITKDVLFKGAFRTFQISAPQPTRADTTSPESQRLLRALKELGL